MMELVVFYGIGDCRNEGFVEVGGIVIVVVGGKLLILLVYVILLLLGVQVYFLFDVDFNFVY